jgi:hypothetical protein
METSSESQNKVGSVNQERKKAFYIYDERMLIHKDHLPDGFEGYKCPEIPERISCIYDHLKKVEMID